MAYCSFPTLFNLASQTVNTHKSLTLIILREEEKEFLVLLQSKVGGYVCTGEESGAEGRSWKTTKVEENFSLSSDAHHKAPM
jgi:hypothetical protein